MKSMALLSVVAPVVADLTLATFDGLEEASAHTWQQKNDPVMGGASYGTFSIEDGVGIMNGTCALIPSLQAPGFIKMETTDSKAWPDVSSCTGLSLTIRSTSTPSPYTGYRVAFGSDSAFLKFGKFFARGFKANFAAPENEFGIVQVPFDQFTKCWDDATGEAIKTCKDFPEFCPTDARLKNLQTMSIWAEGALGDVKLEVKSVGAYGCSSLSSTAPGSLVSFDGAEETSFNFKELNDPVMGGKSTGSWSEGEGYGILDGEVVDVPSLSAPGFIKAAADGKFPDISKFIDGNLVLSVRSSTPDYQGYRVTFVSGALSADFACAGGGSLPFSRGCYKQKFSVPAGDEFVDIKLPFNTFSDKWSSATGEHTVECANDKDVCPTAAKLSKIQRVEFWGEGAAGKLHLEVQSVRAESASGESIQIV